MSVNVSIFRYLLHYFQVSMSRSSYLYYPNPWYRIVASSRISLSCPPYLSEIGLLLPHWGCVETLSRYLVYQHWRDSDHTSWEEQASSQVAASQLRSLNGLWTNRVCSLLKKEEGAFFSHPEAFRRTVGLSVLKFVYLNISGVCSLPIRPLTLT